MASRRLEPPPVVLLLERGTLRESKDITVAVVGAVTWGCGSTGAGECLVYVVRSKMKQ